MIRGVTPHFEYVAGECVEGMAQVSLKLGIPVAFGVLTVDSIEQAIGWTASWTVPSSQVDPVELAILRLGAYEILFSPGIPSGVGINEGVELAKLLGAHEGHRYVNGVLDKIARGRDAG